MPRLRVSGNERNPDTVFLFGLCILAGLGQLSAGAPPGSVEALLPLWAALVWGATLVLSGVLVLAGTLWRDPYHGESIEFVGRVVFGPFALSYGVALLSHQPLGHIASGWLAAAPFFGFGVCCLWRVLQIIRRRHGAIRRQGP